MKVTDQCLWKNWLRIRDRVIMRRLEFIFMIIRFISCFQAVADDSFRPWLHCLCPFWHWSLQRLSSISCLWAIINHWQCHCLSIRVQRRIKNIEILNLCSKQYQYFKHFHNERVVSINISILQCIVAALTCVYDENAYVNNIQMKKKNRI